jgi:leader peptidase (prepilin peptidase) / N-methyltransferase
MELARMLPNYGLPLPFLVASAFAVGACVGSFLNVVIARVPFRESIVWPPSHCMSCGTPIKPFHNVPILSWFLLRGRCRACLAPFSIRYAAIEALFASVCGFAVLRHGLSVEAAREAVMMGFLVPLTFMDLDWWILPRELTFPGIGVGLLVSLWQGREVFMNHLLAASIGVASLMLIGFVGERVFKREAIGRGDIWLLALIGAFLGTRALLPVFLLSSVQGVLVGAPMVLLRRRRERDAEARKSEEKSPEPPPAPPEPVAAEGKGEAEEEEDWQPDPTAVPFGPFLSLAAAEILYFARLPDILFPWPF